MRKTILSISLVFAFAGMCGGAPAEDPKDDDPVVVPVADADEGEEGDDEGDWCCEYKDGDGASQYALTDGPAECNTKYADQDGRWVSGNQCIPCCCKAPNDPDDAEKGHSFELTTPKSCVAGSGECQAADSEECSDGERKPRARPGKANPSKGAPKTRIGRPGSGG